LYAKREIRNSVFIMSTLLHSSFLVFNFHYSNTVFMFMSIQFIYDEAKAKVFHTNWTVPFKSVTVTQIGAVYFHSLLC
jgi:hypothetical protein